MNSLYFDIIVQAVKYLDWLKGCEPHQRECVMDL